jgi:hypothetical protein
MLLIKHPLVQKTLLETYGLDGTDQLVSLLWFGEPIGSCAFYICTNCGYRGNTSRGVKQHGKIHLSNREHFAVIGASHKAPVVVFNSSMSPESSPSSSLSTSSCSSSGSEAKCQLSEQPNQEKSDTYCSKCRIQFQQVKNYLAHKKSYCEHPHDP